MTDKKHAKSKEIDLDDPNLEDVGSEPEDTVKEPLEALEEEVKELIESIEKNSNKVHESADVLYHLVVLLEANCIKIEDVMNELKKRQK